MLCPIPSYKSVTVEFLAPRANLKFGTTTLKKLFPRGAISRIFFNNCQEEMVLTTGGVQKSNRNILDSTNPTTAGFDHHSKRRSHGEGVVIKPSLSLITNKNLGKTQLFHIFTQKTSYGMLLKPSYIYPPFKNPAAPRTLIMHVYVSKYNYSYMCW